MYIYLYNLRTQTVQVYLGSIKKDPVEGVEELGVCCAKVQDRTFPTKQTVSWYEFETCHNVIINIFYNLFFSLLLLTKRHGTFQSEA